MDSFPKPSDTNSQWTSFGTKAITVALSLSTSLLARTYVKQGLAGYASLLAVLLDAFGSHLSYKGSDTDASSAQQ